MIPITVSYTEDTVSRDTNWGYNEFGVDWRSGEMWKFGKLDEEYKSEGDHSKQVYDWEILERFFDSHNLLPNFNATYESEQIKEVKKWI